MLKYIVIGGFLGAGKTTSMIAFSKYLQEKEKKAAILVNDLGAKHLVDGSFTAASACISEEITGNCICYQTENLVDKLRRLRDLKKVDMIFSDIPGCGIGALDHVYHKLNREYPGEFSLCPFVAVADPERLRMIMPEQANIHLPDEMAYLFDAQLREAEVILLNKIDRLTEDELKAYMAFLESGYPHARVFAVSAKTGQGIAAAMDYLYEHSSALPVVDIGYGGPEFIAAEAKLSWYNRQFYVKAQEGASFDGNAFAIDFMDSIRLRLASLKRNAPHLKVLGISETDQMLKASLLGVDYETEVDQQLSAPCRHLRMLVNVRAACESQLLERVMDEAMKDLVGRYHLAAQVFFTECFGMMDEGRA